MKLKAIKLPRGMLLDPKKLSRAIENALDGAALGAQADLAATVATWKHKPDFTIDAKLGRREVFTTDEIYGYVNSGTKPHQILPKNGGVLRIGVGGRPKTVVGALRSNKGAKPKSFVFTSKGVHHPGSKARDFDKAAQKKWDKQLPEIAQRAIDSEVGS